MQEVWLVVLSTALGVVLTWLVTFHVDRRNFRKRYDKQTRENFMRIELKMEIMIEALTTTMNGEGNKFMQNYQMLLKRKEAEKSLKLDIV